MSDSAQNFQNSIPDTPARKKLKNQEDPKTVQELVSAVSKRILSFDSTKVSVKPFEELTPEEVMVALANNGGFIAITASQLRTTEYKLNVFITAQPQIREMLDQIESLYADFSVLKLREKIAAGHWQAVKFDLERKRGYEQHSVKDINNRISGGVNITLTDNEKMQAGVDKLKELAKRFEERAEREANIIDITPRHVLLEDTNEELHDFDADDE